MWDWAGTRSVVRKMGAGLPFHYFSAAFVLTLGQFLLTFLPLDTLLRPPPDRVSPPPIASSSRPFPGSPPHLSLPASTALNQAEFSRILPPRTLFPSLSDPPPRLCLSPSETLLLSKPDPLKALFEALLSVSFLLDWALYTFFPVNRGPSPAFAAELLLLWWLPSPATAPGELFLPAWPSPRESVFRAIILKDHYPES